jgi:DNA-directed RNA polymerase specialized sigma24 family protein
MSDDAAEGLPALQQLLVDKFFLGLVHQLQGQFSNLGSAEVEDAVADAVEKLLKRLSQRPVRSVKDYLAKVAFNDLNRIAKSRVKEVGLGERDDQEAPSANAA